MRPRPSDREARVDAGGDRTGDPTHGARRRRGTAGTAGARGQGRGKARQAVVEAIESGATPRRSWTDSDSSRPASKPSATRSPPYGRCRGYPRRSYRLACGVEAAAAPVDDAGARGASARPTRADHVHTPRRWPGEYDFAAESRFDRLFTGVAVPRSTYLKEGDVRRTEHIKPVDTNDLDTVGCWNGPVEKGW